MIKYAFKRLGLVIILTFLMAAIRSILELWIDYDFDYISGFIVASIYYSVKV